MHLFPSILNTRILLVVIEAIGALSPTGAGFKYVSIIKETTLPIGGGFVHVSNRVGSFDNAAIPIGDGFNLQAKAIRFMMLTCEVMNIAAIPTGEGFNLQAKAIRFMIMTSVVMDIAAIPTGEGFNLKAKAFRFVIMAGEISSIVAIPNGEGFNLQAKAIRFI